MKSLHVSPLRFLALAGSFLLPLHAAQIEWDGATGSSLWNAADGGGGGTTTNWVGNGQPGTNDSVLFGNTASLLTVNPNGNRTVTSMSFNRSSGGYLIGTAVDDHVLTLSDASLSSLDGDHTVNSSISVGSTTNFVVEWFISQDSLTMNGTLSGPESLRKSGSGTLILNGSCNLTGSFFTEVGTLTATPQTFANTPLVLQGGTTNFGGGNATVNLAGISGSGTLTLGSHPLVLGSEGIPSDEATGTLTLPNDVTLSTQYVCDLNGTDHDRVDVQGTLDITGATLSVNQIVPSFGTWTIASATTLVGQFASVPAGFEISYDNNQIVLSKINAVLVDAAATGSGTGETWADAFTSLNAALAAAETLRDSSPTFSREIWVRAGVYYPDNNTGNRNLSFQHRDNLILLGGFAGVETSSDQRDFLNNVTVLSGDIDEDDVNKDADGVTLSASDIRNNNSHTVLTIAFETSTVDGFTITGGRADGSPTNGAGATGRGGALFIDTSVSETPTIRNCRLIGNFAVQGGAVFVHSFGSCDFFSCDFRGNEASGRGGAAYYWRSNVTTTNCQFSGNFAADDGGAIYDDPLEAGESIYLNCTFTGNRAGDNGGAIANNIQTNTSSMTNTVIWNNDSDTPGQANDSVTTSGTYSFSHCLIEHIDLGATGTDNLDGTSTANDPLFLNPTDPADAPTDAGYAGLRPGSPILDTGDQTLVTEANDLEGETRTIGADTDIGAYEQQQATVTNANDSGSGSLRDAIANSARGAHITFDPSLSGGTILISTALAIDNHLIVDGSTLTDRITIESQGSSGVISIADPAAARSLVILSNLVITGGDALQGGGIRTEEDLVLSRCCLLENNAVAGGGLFVDNNASATISDCSFLGNGGNNGAGMFIGNTSRADVVNSIFAGNSGSGSGGGIFNGPSATLFATNTTFAGNEASSGGAISQSTAQETNLTNCILWDALPTPIAGSTITPGSSTNNLIQGETGASDPLFVGNPDPGDGDWSTKGDNFYGDLRLRGNSPAIDAGDGAAGASVNTTSTDIQGNERFLGIIDLGAIEYVDPFPVWIGQFFPGETDPTIVGENADPSGNGLPNILAFVTNTNPLAVAAEPVTITQSATDISFSFPRRDDAIDRSPFIEYSTDLVAFDPAMDGVDGFTILVEDDEFGTSSDGIGIDRVTVTISRTAFTALFGRLRVSN